jgi:hypothetical protein
VYESLRQLRDQINELQQAFGTLAAVRDTVDITTRPEIGLRVSAATGLTETLTTQFSSIGELTISLGQIETLITQRDVATRLGDMSRIEALDEEATALACVAMDRAMDGFTVPDYLDQSFAADTDAFLRGQKPTLAYPQPSNDIASLQDFTQKEVLLLRMAGLSERLANAHVHGALEHYRLNPNAVTTWSDVRTQLAFARDAVCSQSERLRQIREERDVAMRRRRRLRLISTVLGGTLVATVNTAAGGILVPPLIAASAALGGGAAGGVVNLLAG